MLSETSFISQKLLFSCGTKKKAKFVPKTYIGHNLDLQDCLLSSKISVCEYFA